MPDSQEKVCVLCGQSCAGQARIKNAQGQYAHQACAQAQQAKASAGEDKIKPSTRSVPHATKAAATKPPMLWPNKISGTSVCLARSMRLNS